MMTVLMQVVIVVLMPDAGDWNTGRKTVRRQRVAMLLLMILALALMVAAPWCDRRDIATFDGIEAARWTGLASYFIGMVLVHWAEAALGRQFSLEVTIQQGHRLVTGGPYRWLRHPRYAGIIIYMAGVALIFRSLAGLALAAGTALVLLWRIRDEDELLRKEFGTEWDSWAGRTKRLVPFVY